MWAVHWAKLDCVRFLLSLNGDITKVASNGWTVLRTKDAQIRQLLLERAKLSVSLDLLSELLLHCNSSSSNAGKATTRVAIGNVESNSISTLDSIDAIRSTRDRWHLSRHVFARIATVCSSLDDRLASELRSIVTSQEDSFDRICSQFDLENQKRRNLN
jgi:hypothetical protein